MRKVRFSRLHGAAAARKSRVLTNGETRSSFAWLAIEVFGLAGRGGYLLRFA